MESKTWFQYLFGGENKKIENNQKVLKELNIWTDDLNEPLSKSDVDYQIDIPKLFLQLILENLSMPIIDPEINVIDICSSLNNIEINNEDFKNVKIIFENNEKPKAGVIFEKLYELSQLKHVAIFVSFENKDLLSAVQNKMDISYNFKNWRLDSNEDIILQMVKDVKNKNQGNEENTTWIFSCSIEELLANWYEQFLNDIKASNSETRFQIPLILIPIRGKRYDTYKIILKSHDRTFCVNNVRLQSLIFKYLSSSVLSVDNYPLFPTPIFNYQLQYEFDIINVQKEGILSPNSSNNKKRKFETPESKIEGTDMKNKIDLYLIYVSGKKIV